MQKVGRLANESKLDTVSRRASRVTEWVPCGLWIDLRKPVGHGTGLAEQSGHMAYAWIGLRKSDGQGDWVSRPEQLDEFNVAYEMQLNTATM